MRKTLCPFFLLSLLLFLLLSACEKQPEPPLDGDGMIQELSYEQITQEEARRMMASLEDWILLDVRRQDEFDEGHIPGAICLPNEEIGSEPPELLPDPEQTILIYCRSGRRSKEAAQKLADLGYSRIYEFGGILDWSGEIEKEESGEMTEQTMPPEATASPELPQVPDPAEAIRPRPMLLIRANDRTFYASPEDNSSAEALTEELSKAPLELDMRDYGGFEKVGDLPWELPTNDETITTVPGDVILYQGRQITLYYAENTWSFTRLARIGNVSGEELLEVLGDGDVTVTFSVEWSE